MGDHGAGQLSPFFRQRAIRWDARNRVFTLDLDEGSRQALASFMEQFLEMLDDPGSPVLYRLFPPAYSDQADLARQEEYRRLMMEDLVEHRRQEAHLVIATAMEKQLTEEQLMAWSRAVNAIRLMLGTYLDVSEDDGIDDPEEPAAVAYHGLSFILQETIDALADAL